MIGLAFALVAATGSAHATTSRCPEPLRVGVLDFDETFRKPQGIGMTALQTAVAERISIAAGVPVAIRAYPYPRALRAFREGGADLILIAEGAGRRAQPDADRVAMMRLLFVRVGERERPVLPAATELGTLIGLVPPQGAVLEGERVQRVSNYAALLHLLLGGRVRQILGARPSIDSFLADHPGYRQRLGAMTVVGEEAMAAHVAPRLEPACRARLVEAAHAVRRSHMRRILRRTAPGIAPEPFLYPETE